MCVYLTRAGCGASDAEADQVAERLAASHAEQIPKEVYYRESTFSFLETPHNWPHVTPLLTYRGTTLHTTTCSSAADSD